VSRLGRRTGNVAIGLVFPAVLIVLWWVASAHSTSAFFPPLHKIVDGFVDTWTWSEIRADVLPSLRNFAVGFLLGLVVALVLGTMLGLSERARRDFWPLTEYARATPMAAIVPVAVLVLGAGAGTEILLIAFGSVWFIFVNTVDGIRGADPLAREVATSYGLSRGQVIRTVVLPGALPQISAGIRVSLAIGFAVMVIANMYGATSGIGYFILNAQGAFDVISMWAGLLMVGLLGLLFHLIYAIFEHFGLAWHRGWRSAATGKGGG
jgi:sulfonate transport system permease protein